MPVMSSISGSPSPTGDDPHTVTFGTLVEPGVTNAEDSRKLPRVFPHKPPDESLQANQSAAQPCFLASGLPPVSLEGGAPRASSDRSRTSPARRRLRRRPALPGDRFRMRIATNAKPGKYAFVCLIHGGRMTGTLTIVDSSSPVHRTTDVEQLGRQTIQGLAFRAADGRNRALANERQMLTGVIGFNLSNAYLAEFVPQRMSVPVGATVSFDVVAAHSISFNATDEDFGLVRRLPDGFVALNTRALPPIQQPHSTAGVFHLRSCPDLRRRAGPDKLRWAGIQELRAAQRGCARRSVVPGHIHRPGGL